MASESGRAELVARNGGHVTAERHYCAALDIGRGELRLERVSTLLSYGAMLRRAGQPARARKLLTEALDVAEATGALALARYARAAVAVTGGRRHRHNPAGRLTPQELRIARLAKSGASRRDIAARLTLSAGTVRTHLEHIYTKLNIHSARELMASDLDALADSDAG